VSARKIGPLKISVDYDHTDECYVGHIEADERTEACDDRDAAEAAAEAKLRETYDALRERFDPVPVLRWNFDDETPDGPGWWAELGQWVMAASADAWLIDTGRSQNPNPVAEGKAVGFEANQRAAEAALRALGVAFRVEGA
jgi:hypothetical protein